MVQEFRDFIFRGNIVDLAVAVVLGVAFGAVIASFVADILTPLLGILGLPDFSQWTIYIGGGDPPAGLKIGVFLNALISFLAVAASIFFLVVKPMNALKARQKKADEAPAGPSELDLLTEIRDELRKRPA